VLELPKPPWYRRFWLVALAANMVVAAVLVAAVVALWPRAGQRAGQRPDPPATARAVGPQAEAVVSQATETQTALPTSTTAQLEPGVLWQKRGSDGSEGALFDAPGSWRIRWSFNCQSFAEYGGGNFKLSGGGDFKDVSVQRFGVRGSGTLKVTGGGRGRLTIESVCDRWAVKAVAPS
jgi:hypothetical protein